MANTIKFTCVPMGIASPSSGGTPTAQLDVLVTPSLDDQTKLNNFMSWGTAVRLVANQFQLKQQPGTPLTLRTDIIQPGLWSVLMGDAKVDSQLPAINSSGLARPTHTPITEHGVQLSNSRDLAHSFHKSAIGSLASPQKPNFAVPLDVLNQFHARAIEDHSLFRKHPGDAPVIPADSKDPEDVELIAALQTAKGAPEAPTAETLIFNRFGVHAPYFADAAAADPAHGRPAMPAGVYVTPVSADNKHPISPPVKAVRALGHLKTHLINSLRLASGSNTPQLSSTAPQTHLVHHVDRLVSSPSHRSSSAAKKKSESVMLRPAYSFNKRISMLLNTPAIL
jgi:hypothetical protein